MFTHPEFDHHEKVLFCHEERTGLRGIIAVHSTALGPAAGGCRMYPYATIDEGDLAAHLAVNSNHSGIE